MTFKYKYKSDNTIRVLGFGDRLFRLLGHSSFKKPVLVVTPGNDHGMVRSLVALTPRIPEFDIEQLEIKNVGMPRKKKNWLPDNHYKNR